MATSITISNRSIIDHTSVLKFRRLSFEGSRVNIIFQSTSGHRITVRVNNNLQVLAAPSTTFINATGSLQGIFCNPSPIDGIAATIELRATLVSPAFDQSYTITIEDISPTLDFIAVTRGYNEISPIVLRLPPVDSHTRPIFIKLGRNVGSSQNDGVYIVTRGDSFIEFATRDTEVINSVTYNHSSCLFIGGQSSGGAAVNYACITLFSDGSNWYVANYYPMSTSEDGNQYLLRGRALPPLGDNRAFTDVNFNSSAYVFDTNIYNVTRSSSHNVMTLRTPSVSSICIVAYGGSGSPRLKTNSLIIHDIRSTSYIDGFSPNHPYIHIDADNGGGNAKNSGIILFYDATGSGKWYVIGWFYPGLWTFSNLTAAVGDINGYHSIKDVVTPAGEERKICVVPDIAGARFYTLPLETATNPQVIIFKAKDIGSGDNRGIRYSTLRVIGFGPAPTFTPIIDSRDDNRINTDTISIQYGSGGATNARSKYSCVWFISQKKSGEDFLRYYPVVGYVPNP